jgi:hypothetical protein
MEHSTELYRLRSLCLSKAKKARNRKKKYRSREWALEEVSEFLYSEQAQYGHGQIRTASG